MSSSTPTMFLMQSLNTINVTTSPILSTLGDTSLKRGIWSTLYVLAICLTIFGNLLAILVFTFGSRSRTELRFFLCSLSVSDLLIGIFCLPFTFANSYLGYWPFPEAVCASVSFLQILSVTTSVFTNTAIGFDRYCAVVHPMQLKLTRQRSIIILLVIWIVSMLFSSIQLVVSRKIYDNVTDTFQCSEIWSPKWREFYTVAVFLSTYVVPLTLLTIAYSIVSVALWRRTVPGVADLVRDRRHLRSKKKVLKMLVTIVVLFGVCWLPLHSFFILKDFTNHLNDLSDDSKTLMYVTSHWLAMANSFVNPIIYISMNKQFQKDVWQLFRSAWHRLICNPLPSNSMRLSHRTTWSHSQRIGTASQHLPEHTIKKQKQACGEQLVLLAKNQLIATKTSPTVLGSAGSSCRASLSNGELGYMVHRKKTSVNNAATSFSTPHLPLNNHQTDLNPAALLLCVVRVSDGDPAEMKRLSSSMCPTDESWQCNNNKSEPSLERHQFLRPLPRSHPSSPAVMRSTDTDGHLMLPWKSPERNKRLPASSAAAASNTLTTKASRPRDD